MRLLSPYDREYVEWAKEQDERFQAKLETETESLSPVAIVGWCAVASITVTIVLTVIIALI